MSARPPCDRDFVETVEGMFFCLTGYLHPPDRYTAYLKYSPDPGGKWRGAGRAYRRELPYYHVENVAQTIDYLAAHYPAYVSTCPVRDIRFSMVPRERVARYYRPEERLQAILAAPADSLEAEVCQLVAYLSAVTGLPAGVFGITGSLLTGFHNPEFSDIDLLVYGREATGRLRSLIKAGAVEQLRRPGADEVGEWCQRVSSRFPLSLEDARWLAGRRWNYRYFGQRYVSIHGIRLAGEIWERYGERIYRGLGAARIQARLVETRDAQFLPAEFRIADVQVLSGPAEAAGVDELVAYEGLFADVADEGDVVEASGKLESVNGELRRLVVGVTGVPGGGVIRACREPSELR